MIRVSEPLLIGNEKKYLCEAIDDREVSSGGKFVTRFEEAFAKWSGNKYAVAVSSGTAALETAIWSLGIKEINIPTGTIISCYIAAIRAGAHVSFRDNMPRQVLTNVMRCHLFGAKDFSLGSVLVDDLSQFWEPYTVQDVGCYSLYANKLITSGEGGVVVTNREDVYEKAKSYRNLCHSEERFVHYDLGYNFRMSNLQAAVALAQLEEIDYFIGIKQKNRNLYLHSLPASVKSLFSVKVPWMYLVKTDRYAGDMVEKMHELGVECRRFFYPLHRQPCIPYTGSDKFPVADELWEKAFYLPSGLTLTEWEIKDVCQKLRSIL